MSIDLDTIEGRKKYLSDKLDDLLDGINESYGKILMEELLVRLELTIRDFNDEMKILCDELVKKQEERIHLLDILKSKEIMPPQIDNEKDESSLALHINDSNITEIDSSKKSAENIPAWEKKLAKLEKK